MKIAFFLFGILFATSSIADDVLTLRISGGEYGDTFVSSFIKPFAEKRGIDYQTLSRQGGLSVIRAEHESGGGQTDITVAWKNETITACDEDLFIPIGHHFDSDRFIDGAVMECGVALVAYQTTIGTWNDSKIHSVEDFFDPSIEGRRGLFRYPEHVLELALMGAGVSPHEVNEVIQTSEGLDLAFETLDAIKDDIVWYGSGSQANQTLIDEEVIAAMGFDARWINVQDEGYDIRMLQDGFVSGFSMMGVTTYSKNQDLAVEFLQYATRSDVNARFMERMPYSPTITDHGEEISQRYLFHPDYQDGRVIPDTEFWYEHGESINRRFSNWLNR